MLFLGCFEVLVQSAYGVERFPNADFPQFFIRIRLGRVAAVV
jgi:hypothetical protein